MEKDYRVQIVIINPSEHNNNKVHILSVYSRSQVTVDLCFIDVMAMVLNDYESEESDNE